MVLHSRGDLLESKGLKRKQRRQQRKQEKGNNRSVINEVENKNKGTDVDIHWGEKANETKKSPVP